MSEKVYPDRAPTMYDEIIADNTQDGKEVYRKSGVKAPCFSCGDETAQK